MPSPGPDRVNMYVHTHPYIHTPTYTPITCKTRVKSKRRLRNIYSPTSRSNLRSMEAIVGLTDNICVW